MFTRFLKTILPALLLSATLVGLSAQAETTKVSDLEKWEEKDFAVSGKTLFVSAWIAPQEYPFNANAVVNQIEQDWKGFYLGLNYQGKLVGVLYADGKPQTCYSPENIPLLKWSHVAMSYSEGTGIPSIS